jgi:hypothetical protein
MTSTRALPWSHVTTAESGFCLRNDAPLPSSTVHAGVRSVSPGRRSCSPWAWPAPRLARHALRLIEPVF